MWVLGLRGGRAGGRGRASVWIAGMIRQRRLGLLQGLGLAEKKKNFFLS